MDVVKSKMGLSTDVFHATATGLVVVGVPTYEEWYAFGEGLGKMDGAIQWWIGDWAVAEGHVVNGVKSEAYDLLEDETGLKRKTVQNNKYVAENVDLSCRQESLSFEHHAAVAPLPPEDQERWLQKAIDEGLTVAQLRRAIKAEKYEEPILPDGVFRIIYADPPWQYTSGDQHTDTTQDTVLGTHYQSMAIAELCVLPVGDIAADDCVLFLWVTSPLLEESFEVIRAWGFDYKTSMVWDKVRHNVGNYVSVRHELLLICAKGQPPKVSHLVDSVYGEERTAHSVKPVYFRDLIDDLYPDGNRIELFARGELPEHWDAWGNETNDS